jgi:hypothetical protein
MDSLVVEQLEHLGDQVREEPWKTEHDWAVLADKAAELTAMAMHVLRRIEAAGARKQPTDRKMWDEAAAREFVPIFQQWFEYATKVKLLRKECKTHGFPVEGTEEFLHAYNLAKIMALDFDRTVESLRRFERGECRGRPLEEVSSLRSRRSNIAH